MNKKIKDIIEETIDKVADKIGRINLSSGNCGQFTLALSDYLYSKNIESSICIIYKYDDDVKNIDDLASIEASIYHVFLMHDSNYYDGTGKVDVDYIINFSINEYMDSTPGSIIGIGKDNESLHLIVNEQTNWFIHKSKFDKVFKDLDPKKKSKKKLNL